MARVGMTLPPSLYPNRPTAVGKMQFPAHNSESEATPFVKTQGHPSGVCAGMHSAPQGLQSACSTVQRALASCFDHAADFFAPEEARFHRRQKAVSR